MHALFESFPATESRLTQPANQPSLLHPLLEISMVSKTFRTKGGEYQALKNVNLKIDSGEFVTLIGHSGCGKSTLLSIAAGLISPTSGGVILEGKEIREPGPDRGVVFQSHALLPWLTVYENVALAWPLWNYLPINL